MPALCSFDYAIVRVVPHVEREEFFNVGVILFCRERRFLAARISLDAGRLTTLAPNLDPAIVQAYLDLIPRVCAGGAAAGALGELSQVERFRWLTSPHSTVIQLSDVHSGLCHDPEDALADLLRKSAG